ncbi:DUF4260 domain-containing protein [Devosia sp. 2618]|uniref:DUF4260 domain-containing protein n=1 Tax=Devosia sp. 2618 TaxID=3156454 RepID=UPI0033974C18
MTHFVRWQRVEGLLILLAGLVIAWQVDSSLAWWAALLLFFAPDLSFLGYGLGPKLGGAIYNSVHVYAFGVIVLAAGMVLAMPFVAAMGALWFSHCGFDRALGYGLKSPESFSDTHLGRIGKHKP